MILFVTGTGTGVGKTVATAALAVAYRAAGWRPVVVKPAQTGTAEGDSDIRAIRALAGDVETHQLAGYPEPLAPYTAARRAGLAPLELEETSRTLRGLDGPGVCVLVEGAGGVLVNLGEQWTMLDLAHRVGDGAEPEARPGVAVVSSTGLGSLNAAALTLLALRARSVSCAGLIGGSVPADPDLATRCTLAELRGDAPGFDRAGVPWLGEIPAGAGRWGPAEFQASAPQWLRVP